MNIKFIEVPKTIFFTHCLKKAVSPNRFLIRQNAGDFLKVTNTISVNFDSGISSAYLSDNSKIYNIYSRYPNFSKNFKYALSEFMDCGADITIDINNDPEGYIQGHFFTKFFINQEKIDIRFERKNPSS